MNIHMSAIKKRFKRDVDNELNGLIKIVTERKPLQKREQLIKKIGKDSSPRLDVQHISNFETIFTKWVYQM